MSNENEKVQYVVELFPAPHNRMEIYKDNEIGWVEVLRLIADDIEKNVVATNKTYEISKLKQP